MTSSSSAILFGKDSSRCDWVLEHPGVSSLHCQLLWVPAQQTYCIEDLNSSNGTWIQGRRLVPGERAPIGPGTRIGFGQRASLVIQEVHLTKLIAPATWRGPHRASLDEQGGAQDSSYRSDTAGGGAVGAAAPSAGGSGQQWVIGRRPDCDVVLEAANVSSQHARLEATAVRGRFRIQDLNSSNGTYVGSRERRVESAEVGLDDVLFFGTYRMPVRLIVEPTSQRRSAQTRVETDTWLTIGRDPSCGIQVDHPRVSRQHARVRRLSDGGLEIEDLASGNGVFVNGRRIQGLTRVQPGDSVSLGSVHVELSQVDGGIRSKFQGKITLEARDLVVEKPGKAGPQCLLNEISLTIYPTEFVGLMGPSGAGKTTLLTALNGYQAPNRGSVLLNGSPLYGAYDEFAGEIGYVPQDDIVFPQLTVYETLYYTACLRLPPETTKAEIDERIRSILTSLRIEDKADVRIGDSLNKGISGGQRKRVNLAQELLTDPSLLFLDEPTSGLDADSALTVMQLLRGLADSGKTILLTIHQPSGEAYRLMDNVVYLFSGSLAYYGPTVPDSAKYFYPDLSGPALDAVVDDPSKVLKPLNDEQEQAKRTAQPLAEIVTRRRTAYRESRWYQRYVGERAGKLPTHEAQPLRVVRVSLVRQFQALVARCFRIKLRDRIGSAVVVLLPALLAGLIAFAVRGDTDAPDAYFQALSRHTSALFLLVITAIWFSANSAARELVAERAIYDRERMANLRLVPYLGSKVVVYGSICAIQSLFLLLVPALILGITENLLHTYVVLWLSGMAAVGLGLAISAAARTVDAASQWTSGILVLQIVLGGLALPLHDLPVALQWVSPLTIARWGNEGILSATKGDIEVDDILARCGNEDGEEPRRDDQELVCDWFPEPDATGWMFLPSDRRVEPTIPVEPTNDAELCAGICTRAASGRGVTPLELCFGVDPDSDFRREMEDRAEEREEEFEGLPTPSGESRERIDRQIEDPVPHVRIATDPERALLLDQLILAFLATVFTCMAGIILLLRDRRQ